MRSKMLHKPHFGHQRRDVSVPVGHLHAEKGRMWEQEAHERSCLLYDRISKN